jgi:hypothetical protein
MVTAVWGVRGGAGVTTVAAAMALSAAQREQGALLVDLGGDALELLARGGVADPGVAEWLRARPDVMGCWSGRTLRVGERLTLAPRGVGLLDGGSAALRLFRELDDDPRNVIVDCGQLGQSGSSPHTAAGQLIARRAHHSFLVTRACRLAMRRLRTTPVRCTAVIVVREPGRGLSAEEIETAADAPVVAELPWDPAVAWAVDHDGFAGGVPDSLASAFGGGDLTPTARTHGGDIR